MSSPVLPSLTEMAVTDPRVPPDPDPARAVATRLLHAEVSLRRTPAIQYRHFTRDSVRFSYDHGLAHVARGEAAGVRTTFHGFSVTKTVTAVAILQLVDQGLVDLEAAAGSVLPDFPYGPEVTVRNLLTHSAGIPNPMPMRWTHPAGEHDGFDARAFFDGIFARYARVKSRPNERFAYSNLGYVLLGRIIEEVSGLPYEAYVARQVFEPMGISPAELGFTIAPSTHAIGYHRRYALSRLLLPFVMDTRTYLGPPESGWEPFVPFHVNGAAYGGLMGTADGFTRYLQALLDPDAGLLSEESRRALFRENVLNGGSRSAMALSWHLGKVDGHRYAAHAGGGGGFYAEIRVYPELGRGSVVLFNRSGFSDARFLDRVDRHLLGEEPEDGSRGPG